MKSRNIIVEYTGIGDDADEMHQDHEVQLARQQCYHAARDAIALHHILKDVSEQEGLESWVSEKLTLAASNLNDVIGHLESRRNDNDDVMDEVLPAFNFESAEALYNEMLGEGQVTELDASTMQAYLKKRKDSPTPRTLHKAGVQAAGVRNAKEKIHDKDVTKAAKQTGRVQENASAGGTCAGAMATGVTGAANKPGTGKPKKIGNIVKRTNPTVGKGIY